MLIDKRYRRLLLPILVVGGMLALAYWQVVTATAVVSERLSNVSSIRFRLDLLEVSRMLIQDHPIFGVGMGNFSYYFLEYGGHWETLAFDLPTPHNTFVLVLSTMGLAAFVPFACIFLTMFSRLSKALMLPRRLNLDRARVVSGHAPDSDHLERWVSYAPALPFLSHELPDDARLLLVSESRSFYIDRPVLVEDPFRLPWLAELANGCRDPQELARRVRAAGATHLLVNETEMDRLARQRGASDYWEGSSPAERRVVAEFLDGVARPLYRVGGVWIAEVPAPP
jgi:hypothetical protein